MISISSNSRTPNKGTKPNLLGKYQKINKTQITVDAETITISNRKSYKK